MFSVLMYKPGIMPLSHRTVMRIQENVTEIFRNDTAFYLKLVTVFETKLRPRKSMSIAVPP